MTTVSSDLEVLEAQNGYEKLGKACPKDQSTQHHPECHFLELLTAVHLQYIRVLPRKRCYAG
jgi:hypothetical protein